jgi:RNase P protein component
MSSIHGRNNNEYHQFMREYGRQISPAYYTLYLNNNNKNNNRIGLETEKQ